MISGLVSAFVSIVTTYYFLSPYLLQPHHDFTEKMSEYIGARSPAIAAAVAKSRSDSSFWSWSEDPSPVFILENWTKWTLRLVPENRRDGVIQVKPQSYVTLDNQKFPLLASFDWRPEYGDKIQLDKKGRLMVEAEHPWYSQLGIYHHYSLQLSQDNTTLQYVPRFMFGLPPLIMSRLFPSPDAADKIPILGMFTNTVNGDRIIIQTFMSSVALTVIIMLKIHVK